MTRELSREVAQAPDIRWHAMALTGLNLRCKPLARHVEDLGDLLAVFLEAESQVEVGQLYTHVLEVCQPRGGSDRDILEADAAVYDSLFVQLFQYFS